MGEYAVVYARYSSHSQTEQSIEGQLAAAHKYAREKGYTIVHEYCDRAKTGRNDDRAEFQRMLADTSKKTFSVIIVWKVDRFGRNREELTFNKHKCKKNGVRVEYVAESVPDSPEGVIMEALLEGMAEYYSLQLSENVRRGLAENAKKHHVISGKTPYGLKIGPDKKFAIDDDKAPVVRRIFDLYLEGWTMADICRELNGVGLRTSTGGLWGKDSIRPILKNERYAGTYIFKGEREEGVIPAIVTMDEWKKAQEMMKTNKAQPSKNWTYADYLLSGKVFCGKCGSPMIGVSGTSKNGGKYGYYVCEKRRRDHSCDKKPVPQDKLESVVLDHALSILNDDAVIEDIITRVVDLYEREKNTDERRSILAEIDDCETKRNNLYRTLTTGFDTPTLRNMIKDFESRIEALERSLHELDLSMGPEITPDLVRYFMQSLRMGDLSDKRVKKRVIQTFINAVYVYDDRFDVVFNVTGENKKIVPLEEVETCSTSALDCLLYSIRSNTVHMVRRLSFGA